MKILFFSLFLPHARADHAAAFCGFKLLRHLSGAHEVSVLSFARSRAEQLEADGLREFCAQVETVLLPVGLGTKLRSRLRLLSMTPISISQSYSEEMAFRLRAFCQREQFDVLHAEYSPMGQYLGGAPLKCGVRGVHVIDLLEPQMRNRAAHLSFSRRKLECWVDAALALRYEARLCSRFDVVFACAPRIRQELLTARPELNVLYVPPGVDPRATPREHVNRGKNLLFVGAMWREENIDAILWFYQRVFHRIRARVPDATLTIVGGSPAEQVRRLGADPQVRVTGYVDDFGRWYLASDVSIAPVRIAGGVLCKVLDAMGAGLPVVTTSFGNDGVGAQPFKEILIADTPDEFAAHAVSLLENPQLRNDMGRKRSRLHPPKLRARLSPVSGGEHVHSTACQEKRKEPRLTQDWTRRSRQALNGSGSRSQAGAICVVAIACARCRSSALPLRLPRICPKRPLRKSSVRSSLRFGAFNSVGLTWASRWCPAPSRTTSSELPGLNPCGRSRSKPTAHWLVTSCCISWSI